MFIAFNCWRLYSCRRFTCTSKIPLQLSLVPVVLYTYFAKACLLASFTAANLSRTALSSANFLKSASFDASFLKPSPMHSVRRFVSPWLLASNQRRYAIPFVTFLKASGVTVYWSWNTLSLMISEWSLETPFTELLAAQQRLAIFTRLSRIIDILVTFSLSPFVTSIRWAQ